MGEVAEVIRQPSIFFKPFYRFNIIFFKNFSPKM
jgi:hypothetical protein